MKSLIANINRILTVLREMSKLSRLQDAIVNKIMDLKLVQNITFQKFNN
jgi:hypothetical protein